MFTSYGIWSLVSNCDKATFIDTISHDRFFTLEERQALRLLSKKAHVRYIASLPDLTEGMKEIALKERIKAIKAYRRANECYLLTAKNAVDAYLADVKG